MKALRYPLAVLVGAALALAIVAIVEVLTPSMPHVLVEVMNQTGQQVREINIKYKNGLVTHRGLSVGKAVTLPFAHYGEGSYELQAVLADGKVLNGGIGYVESGYQTKEVLEPERVVSSYR